MPRKKEADFVSELIESPEQCPFCGRLQIVAEKIAGRWYTRCLKCSGGGPWRETKEAAVAAYNARA